MLLWSVPTRRLLRRYDKSEATAPTPTRAGRGRWGRRRTGWRRCCLRWVSHRSAGWWPTRSSPPSRCSSRNLKTDGRRGNRRITFYTQTTNLSISLTPDDSWRKTSCDIIIGSYLNTACGPQGTSPASTPPGRPRRRTGWSATEGRTCAGRWPTAAVL